MPDQDPYAATAIKPATKKTHTAAPASDPYAATATQASMPAAPSQDFTSNPSGEGLYDMQGPHGPAKVPFSKVQSAQQQGYSLPPATGARYRDDMAATKPSWFQRVTEPSEPAVNPNTTPTDSSWEANRDAAWNAAVNAMRIGGTGASNILKRGARTAVGGAALPFHAIGLMADAFSSDPEVQGRAEAGALALHPGAQVADRIKEAQQDWQKSPALAGENVAGDVLGMWALERASGGVKAAGGKLAHAPEALARAVTDTGEGPVRRLVKETQAANEKIDAVNQDRTEAHRIKQAAADQDYRGDLLRLRQKYEQDVRNANEKARTGTATDRAQVQAKNLAAKQQYDQAVRDRVTKFTADRAKAEQTNAAAQRAHLQKIGQTAQHNRAVTTAEQAKSAQAAQTQVGGSQLIYGLRQLDKALRAKANDLYGAIREKMADASLPSDTLADTVRAAQEKWIRGSPAKVAEFNAMLSAGEPGPELTLANQTAQNMGYKDFRVAITNPLTRSTLSRVLPPDVWQAAIGQGTKPVSWNDLQGFYEETGAKIADGPQPGKADIYKALQQVHEEIGNQMGQLAETRGMDKQFDAARKFYREYMQTFHEPTGPSASGSPVAQALQAKDPEVAAAKFAGKSGDRGIANLRRYSDSLANLAQQVRQNAQSNITVPARKPVDSIPPPEVKPVPTGAALPLPPVLEQAPAPRAAALPLPPVVPDAPTIPLELRPRETISAPDLVAARRAAAEARAGKAQTRGTWVATWPIFQAMRALWGGHIPSIPTMVLESAGTYATTRAATTMMRYPPMLRFLTEARPEDVSLIPPDLRGELPGLVTLARRQGIRVAPALVAATAGMAGQQRQQGQAPLITPADAIQAMQPTPAGGQQ